MSSQSDWKSYHKKALIAFKETEYEDALVQINKVSRANLVLNDVPQADTLYYRLFTSNRRQ